MTQSNNLKKCREEAGLTKVALSRLSGVNPNTIRDIENLKIHGSNSTRHRLVSGLNQSTHKPKKYTFEEIFP